MDPSLDEKINLLQKTELFSQLSREELAIVAQNSQIIQYQKGTAVFGEDDSSRELYIVKEGEVLITRHLDDDDDIHLAQYVSGDCFGELDLIEDAPRKETAVTIKDTVLLVFPKRGLTFSDVLQEYPEVSARLLYRLISIVSNRVRRTHQLIRERSPWIEHLKRQMFKDKLTGLYSQDFLREDFPSLLPEYGKCTSLLLIKPDNFKELNDRFGHDAGDKILILISIFIQSVVRAYDIAIRYRGDEFAVVLPGTDTKAAVAIAKELGEALYEMNISEITDGKENNVFVSVGIATFPDHAINSEALIDAAYGKMLKARRRGGNRIVAMG
jgi:diguanylate cyclase (GGDEF)-like protein